jgi:hypothetical protein
VTRPASETSCNAITRSREHAGDSERLPAALDRVLELAPRVGDDELLEWAGPAALGATDLGKQLGMLLAVEAERRRAVIRGAMKWVDGPAG